MRLNDLVFSYDLRLERFLITMFLNLHGIKYFNNSKLREYKVNYLNNSLGFFINW